MSIVHAQSTINAAQQGVPSGPVVDAATGGVTNGAAIATVIAGVAYNGDGTEDASTAAGLYTVSRGSWLTSGSPSEVWLERTINSGTLTNSDPGTGRHQLNLVRTLAVQDTTIPGGAVTCNVTVEFYDAATGGNLLDAVTYTLSAERQA